MIKLKRFLTRVESGNDPMRIKSVDVMPRDIVYPLCTSDQYKECAIIISKLIDEPLTDHLVIRMYGAVHIIKVLAIGTELILPFVLKDYGYDYGLAYRQLWYLLSEFDLDVRRARKFVNYASREVTKDRDMTYAEINYYNQSLAWVVASPHLAKREEMWVK